MAGKALVIITSGSDDREKAVIGFAYAKNVKTNKLLDDVRVILFGPSERAVASGDMDFVKGVRTMIDLGVIPIACSGVAKLQNIVDPLTEQGLQIDNVGPVISNYIKDGYQVLTF